METRKIKPYLGKVITGLAIVGSVGFNSPCYAQDPSYEENDTDTNYTNEVKTLVDKTNRSVSNLVSRIKQEEKESKKISSKALKEADLNGNKQRKKMENWFNDYFDMVDNSYSPFETNKSPQRKKMLKGKP